MNKLIQKHRRKLVVLGMLVCAVLLAIKYTNAPGISWTDLLSENP